MPNLKVDGIEIEVPQGATVLQACEPARPIQSLIRHFRPELERRIIDKESGQQLEAAE